MARPRRPPPDKTKKESAAPAPPSFSCAQAIANVTKINPDATILQVSARNCDGMANWYGWLRAQRTAARQSAFG